MRLDIAWHIMNKDLKDDSHRCGYCGVVGCTISIIKRSGFGLNKTYGAESDCTYFYNFSIYNFSMNYQYK
jgi:hypothetical protein